VIPSFPQLYHHTIRHLEPDELAKQLGNRDLVLGITSTLSYRALRKRKVVHMFRFGLNDEVSTALDEDDQEGPGHDSSDEAAREEGGAGPPLSMAQIDEARFKMADPTSVSELRFRDIGSLKTDAVRGAALPGVSRTAVKKYLKYRFDEVETGHFSVLGLYKESTIIDTFTLKLSHLTSLMELQTMLYTPQGSKTTFVLPRLVKVIGEMQMKSVLL
jgi:hypothetical protein